MIYYELTQLWPNKAGKLKSLIATQKRLIESEAKKKQTDEIKKLLILDSQINDVADDLLNYIQHALTEISKDFKVYHEGAKNRRIIEEQSEHLKYYFDEFRRKN